MNRLTTLKKAFVLAIAVLLLVVTGYAQCINPLKSTISASGATTFCVGSTVDLSIPEQSGVTYQWVKDAAWKRVGATDFTTIGVDYIDMAVDAFGTPYIAYRNIGSDYKATVQKFNGTDWEVVGTAGFSAGVIYDLSIAIDQAGTPYVAYQDDANDSKATVQKFNGTAWEVVGTAGFSANSAGYTSIAFNASNVLYISYVDGSNDENKATVQKFNGTAWEVVGVANFSAGGVSTLSMAINASGIPYVAYQDRGNGSKATVQKFNGTAWEVVGTAGFSADMVYDTRIAVAGSGEVYVAYQDQAVGYKGTVQKFNGTAWEVVGVTGFSEGFLGNSALAVDGSGVPYIAYKDGSSYSVFIQKFTGTAWEVVGTTNYNSSSLSIAIDGSGVPYIAFANSNNIDKANVQKFDGTTLAGATSATYAASFAGKYSVRVKNCAGAYSLNSIPLTLTYTGADTARITASGATNFCVGGSVNLSIPAQDGATYQWVKDAAWKLTGNAGFSAGAARNTSIAIDAAGTPYIVYKDTTRGSKATVQKFNGTAWEVVGTAGFSAGKANDIAIAIDPFGTPYVVYQDEANDNKATVQKFDGATWEVVGIAGFSDGKASYTSIAINATGTPYIIYQDATIGNKSMVQKFNGSEWEIVGGRGFSSYAVYYTAIAFDSSNIPYVVYADGDNGFKATVQKLNGNSWYVLGSSNFSAGSAIHMTIAINASGTPYVAYQDAANGNKVTVQKYNDNIGDWEVVGTAGFSTGEATTPSIAMDASGTPYVAYADVVGDTAKATVQKYTGAAWEVIGTRGFSAGTANYTGIAIDALGTAYVVYQDAANNNKATVQKFEGALINGATDTIYTASTTGNYSVRVRQCAAAYALNTIPVTVNYTGVATASITAAGSTTLCAGDSIQLSVPEQAGATYQWIKDAAWKVAGNAGFSAGEAYHTSMAIDAFGTPYVVFEDGGNGYKATVQKFNGTAWEVVGAAGFSAGGLNYSSIAIDAAGTPYVVYLDRANANKATVQKFNSTAWEVVGTTGFSIGESRYTSIAIDGSGTPYVAYCDEGNYQKATVQKFDGTSWVPLGADGLSLTYAFYTSIAIDASGTPYVTYLDGFNNNKASVQKYTGSGWEAVGALGFSAGTAYYTSIAIDPSGTPYVAYGDQSFNGKAAVQKFNGTAWELVGPAGFSGNSTAYTSIAIDASGTPYIGYMDYMNSTPYPTVRKFTGENWNAVSGYIGFSEAAVNYTSIAIDGSGVPYIAYQDAANGYKATVQKMDGDLINGATTAFYNATETGRYSVKIKQCLGAYSLNTKIVQVNSLPVVAITGLATEQAYDAAEVTLEGTPTGGSFTVNNLSKTVYKAADYGVGKDTVVYHYTDISTTCSSTDTVEVTVVKADQGITFDNLATKTFGDTAFALTGTASSGITVTYTSSDTSIASISHSTVTIKKAGTVTITASQAGNNNYNAANSVERTLLINKANQSIAFDTLTTKTFGDVAFNLTGTASSGATITYTSSDTSIASISGNTVTINKAGTVTITANQAGNGNYNAATAVTHTLIINKANQSITFAALANKTFGDAAFNLTATASSGATITYTSSDASIASISGNTVTINKAGSVTITANQVGNGNYNAATAVDRSLVINKAAQSITFAAFANKTFGDAAFDLIATGGASGNGIIFTSSDASIASISGNTVTINKAGTVTITANQAGNGNYNAAIAVTRTLIIDKANQSITFAALANKTFGDAAFDLSATGGTSGNGIIFTSSDASIASISGNTLTINKAGTVTITASQAGNTNYNAAAVERSLLINKAAQSITFAALANKTFGDAAFDLSATGGATGNAVTFTSSDASIASISGNTVTINKAGTVTITATQTGNDNYSAATSVERSLIINKAAQSITFAELSAKTFGDAAFALNATANSGAVVAYTSSDASIASISGNTVTINKAGTVTITANQAGNDNYNAATAVQHSLVINKATQTITFDPIPDKKSTDAPFALNATSNSALTVSFVVVSGPAIITGNMLTLTGDTGTVIVRATQVGNDNVSAATPVERSFIVSKTTTGIKAVNKVDLALLAYPNPFNNKLSIAYTLTEKGKITLEVINVLGEVQAVLLNAQEQGAGAYQYELNKDLAVGNYVIRLLTPTGISTLKVLKTE